MSPQAALESPVFRFYALAAAGLLLLAGVVLTFLKWGLGKNVDHAWHAYAGWLLLVPATFACLFLGRISTIAYLTIMAGAGFREFARATRCTGTTPSAEIARRRSNGWLGVSC